jgi:hypothetical protein
VKILSLPHLLGGKGKRSEGGGKKLAYIHVDHQLFKTKQWSKKIITHMC